VTSPSVEQQTAENLVPAVVENATALGLKWQLRPATVIAMQGGNATIRYDGETAEENSRATSMIGAISVGTRVMVVYVPPAGNYITGILNTQWQFADTLNVQPPASSASRAILFNSGYSIYVDNTGTGAAASRFWVDTPDTADVIIGPRAGASFINSLRLRTDATTATAANCFIDSASQQIRRSTSSIRYKTEIRDADLDLATLLKLRGVRFKDKNEHAALGDEAPDHIGFIAEEVAELGLTEFVHFDGEGRPDGVQYDRIIVGLLALVKDVMTRLTELERDRRSV
jgi:Chaperone of endosialidase